MTLVQVRLFRDCFQTPWGFRLQGGKDLSQPLTIQRVFANTPSEGELHRGDVIVAINGRDTSNFTHKAAQDAISGGGGQIELLVSRPPPGQVHITPLSPVRDTRAPAYPNPHPPHIYIPIHKPGESSRIIPISPHKPVPAPPKPAPAKLSPKPAAKPTAPLPDMAAGHIPTKITMNKFGGGGMDFAYSPKTPPASGYRSVTGPPMDHLDYGAPRPQNQFSAPQQFSPPPAAAPAGEGGVSEEEYSAVSDRRKQFMDPQRPPHSLDEEDYPTAPVWERRKLFGKRRSPPRGRAAHRSAHSNPAPSFARPRAGEQPVTFGVDYAKPHTMRQEPKAKPQRQRPPAVNARRAEDETDSSWSNTLRGDGRDLKPWEIEAMEAEKYQNAPMEAPYRPHMAPPTAPKPKPSPQMSPQRSVPPYHPPPQPSRPHHAPPPQHSPNASNRFAGGAPQQDGPKFVHLQYNSPMGLYSQDNVKDAYVGQTHGQALSPSSGQQGQKPPVPLGDRDWSDSAVYQMVHSSQKTTTSSRQDGHGPPKGQTVTTTKVTQEHKYPGQAPQKHVTETVQRGGAPPNYVFNEAIGMSDF